MARCGSARIDAAAGGQAVGQMVHVLDVDAVRDALRRSRRAAGRTPSSSACTSACPARESSASRSGPASGTTRARLASSRSTPLPRRFQAGRRCVRPSAHGDRLGQLLDRAPAEPVQRVGQPLLASLRGLAPPALRRLAAASASADSRRTVTTRWTSVTRLPTATIHSAIGSRMLDAAARRTSCSPAKPGGDQRDHQPLGPLDQAVDRDRQADRSRRAPWCTRRPGRWPGRRSATAHSTLSSPPPAYHSAKPPKIAAVGDPVEGGVQEGAPAAGAAQLPRHVAVDEVGEDEQRDDDRAPEELAPGVEDQRTRHHSGRCR